jgi:hypothetical protein
VTNLVSIRSDQTLLKRLQKELWNVQLEIQKPLIPLLHGQTSKDVLYALEDTMREDGDRLEDSLAEDEEKWSSIALERSKGLDDGRENLAVQLQVPAHLLTEEIRKLKQGVREAPEGHIRDFLRKALADYRMSKTIASMAITADVCFAVDCTGSMKTVLDYTKRIIRELLGELKKEFPHVKVRMGFVGYRDFNDYGSPSFEVVQFGSVDSVSPMLDNVKALSGFGDDW